MTMHNAKGLEFRIVFVAGMEDGIFPHSRALGDPDELEEERRLAYVAMTRAQERLYLTRAWSRTFQGRSNSNPPSRFWKEVPEELVDDRSSEHGAPSRRALAKTGPRRQYDLTAVEDDEDEDLAVGDRVLHSSLGKGRVTEVAAGSSDEEVVVDFEEYGEKRLVLAYAPLVRI
jgi:DNA helicase-2/ATP-dependent DNA helicase PcrA